MTDPQDAAPPPFAPQPPPAAGNAAPPAAGDAAPPGADGHGAPPAALVRSPLSDGEWHRLHPLTPLLRGGLFLLVVVGIVVANLRDRLIVLFLPMFAPETADGLDDYEEFERSRDPIDWIVANNLYLLAVLAVLGVLIVLIVVFTLSWRFHTFRITGDDVEVRSGVLFRTQRRAPLDRVQGVNLVRPMIARLLGMAKLEVVGAGTDANVKLEYLSTTNAEAVRADILRLASGRRLADAAAATPAGGPRGRVAALSQTVSRGVTGLIEGDEAPVAVPESVVHIPVGRLVASQVVSMSTVMFVLLVAAVAVAASFGVTWVLFAYVPAIIGLGVYWVRSITRSLRYSIAPTPDGVRITFGLFTTTTEIVPPGRIHAVEIVQPVLWRPFGWWRIRINRLSGRSASDSNADQFTTALPVGTTTDVERVLRLLKPEVPDAEWTLIVGEGLTGPGETDTFTTMPRRARILRPFSWRRTGFRLTEDLLLMRRGFVWRTLSLLPLARLQSFGAYQGPVDRLLDVASVRAHVVSGPVDVHLPAFDRTTVLTLLEDVAHASVRAAAGDRSHRWAKRADASRLASPAQRPEPELARSLDEGAGETDTAPQTWSPAEGAEPPRRNGPADDARGGVASEAETRSNGDPA